MSPDPYNHDDEFNQVIGGFHNTAYQPPTSADASPYGPNPHIPAHSIPGQTAKPGLTRRGKTALAIGGVVLATGSFLTWQHYDAEAATQQARAQELALQRDQIALEMQKELNKATATSQKTQSVADKTRQKQIDACVNNNKDLLEQNRLGTTLSSVISDCQAQYPAAGTSPDGMQEAASTTDSHSGGIGVTGGLAIAGGVLIVGLYGASRRSRTTTNYHPA